MYMYFHPGSDRGRKEAGPPAGVKMSPPTDPYIVNLGPGWPCAGAKGSNPGKKIGLCILYTST